MRKSALTASGIALVLALTACGGEDSNGPEGTAANTSAGGDAALFSSFEELVSSAEAQTSDAQSARFSMTMTMLGTEIKAEGEGNFDAENPTMSMTMAMPDTPGVPSGDIEMRMVDGDVYMKMPNATGGKPWQKMSMDDVSGEAGMSSITENSDPTKVLENLQAAGAEIKDSEKTDLDGQSVTHYTVEIDPGKMMESMGGQGMDPQASAMFQNMDPIPMDLYLNDENLPVHIEMEMDLGKMAEEAGADMSGAPSGDMTMKMVMTYSDWGTPVTVEAPAADEVTEAPVS